MQDCLSQRNQKNFYATWKFSVKLFWSGYKLFSQNFFRTMENFPTTFQNKYSIFAPTFFCFLQIFLCDLQKRDVLHSSVLRIFSNFFVLKLRMKIETIFNPLKILRVSRTRTSQLRQMVDANDASISSQWHALFGNLLKTVRGNRKHWKIQILFVLLLKLKLLPKIFS